MNWPRYVVEYGDIIAITFLTGSVVAALAIVLRGFQAHRRTRNTLCGVGIGLCCLFMLASLQYLRISPQKITPLKPVFKIAGRRAPDLIYTSLTDNRTHRLSEFQGKVVVVNLWATWCAACRNELADLNRLQHAYPNRLVVLAITDEAPETVAQFQPLAQLSVHKGRILTSNSDGLYIRSDVARPLTHVIDAQGILRQTLIGQQSFEQLQTEVVRYLSPEG